MTFSLHPQTTDPLVASGSSDDIHCLQMPYTELVQLFQTGAGCKSFALPAVCVVVPAFHQSFAKPQWLNSLQASVECRWEDSCLITHRSWDAFFGLFSRLTRIKKHNTVNAITAIFSRQFMCIFHINFRLEKMFEQFRHWALDNFYQF